jgi:phosphoenolpyruvate synthase/pyruvate phosphate dikinase
MNKKQAIDYLKKTEIDVQSAHAALFFTDLVYSSYADSHKVHGLDYGPVFCYISFKKMHMFFQFLTKKNMDAVAKKMYTDFKKNPKIFLKRIEEHKELAKKNDIIWRKYLKSSKKEMLGAYKKLLEISVKWWHYAAIGEDKGAVIDLEVVPNFERRYGLNKTEARDIVYNISHPEEQTLVNLERKTFLEICNEILINAKLIKALKTKNYDLILGNKKIFSKIQFYINEFFWIKTTFYSSIKITPVILLKHIDKEIKKLSKKEILGEIKNIKNNFLDIHNKKKKILERFKLTKEDKEDIEFARLTTYWIEQRKLGMMRLIYYFTQIFEDIAKKFKIDYHEIALSRADEIRKFLESGKRVEKEIIEKRNDDFMSIYEKNNKITEYYGKDAKDLFKLAKKREEKEIKGVVASKTEVSKIRGVVRIIKNPEKQDLKKGEILVTSMTRVEFVPMMRKAKAIITDEGGIACHAAIVSRELRVPCIIGTKIATHVLKSGDLVEVDTEEGIVRKIEAL